MDPAEQHFRDFLRQRKLKLTNERVALLRAVRGFSRPFEAEELLLTLRDTDYRISKATVYRTLKHLIEARLVRRNFFGGGKQSHYEFIGAGGETDVGFDHLVDMESGQIITFPNELVIKLRQEIAGKLGYHATGHRFQIIGRRIDAKP